MTFSRRPEFASSFRRQVWECAYLRSLAAKHYSTSFALDLIPFIDLRSSDGLIMRIATDEYKYTLVFQCAIQDSPLVKRGK